MKVATWNVNSVRARLDRLLAWLERQEPDLVCLQELKVTGEAFPREAVEAAGYHAAVFGQKTYNGVAILAREEPANVKRGMGEGDADPQARLIGAEVEGVRVLNAYVPNGGEVGSDKWVYKLEWISRFAEHVAADASPSARVLVCGDLNVARDDLDVARPQEWADSVLCHPDARESLARLREWGLVDVLREKHPEGGIYSWWDYRRLAFPKGDGLRIDHILATPALAARCTRAEVDRDERKGSKPSDHAPVVAVFDL